jgi:hypothetical protein
MSVLGGSRVPSSPELGAADTEEQRQQPDAEASGRPSLQSELPALTPPDAVLRAITLLAFFALLLGRALAPALPGSQSGIARWILITETLGSLASQLLVIVGSLFAVRVLVLTLRERGLPMLYRILAVASGAAVVTVTLGAAQASLDPIVTLVMGVSAASSALLAVPLAIRPVHTRAAGMVIALAGSAALLHLFTRLLGVYASEHAVLHLYQTARHLAGIVFTLDAGSIVLVAIWLGALRSARSALLVVVTLAIAALVSWAALRGSLYGAPGWQVILGRALGELTRTPAPLLMPFLRYWLEAAALLMVLLTVFSRRGTPEVRAALALAVLTRASADVPALALCLVLAATITALATLTREPFAASRAA